MQHHFSEVKRPQTHLLTCFSTILNMAGFIFLSPKKCRVIGNVASCYTPKLCYIHF